MDDWRIRDTLRKQALQRAIGEIEAAKATIDYEDFKSNYHYDLALEKYDTPIGYIKEHLL